MEIKNKGKVHPSPSSSPSSSTAHLHPCLLNLLPAAILVLVSVLSPEDCEVLAYMITRSMKTQTPSSAIQEPKKKSLRKPPNSTTTHRPPLFNCDCFDCYTSYWFKWDSSPNRELIHQAIEAFEDHLTSGEASKKNAGRGKRRDKLGRRVARETRDRAPLPEVTETCVITRAIQNEMTPATAVSPVQEEEAKSAEVAYEKLPETGDSVVHPVRKSETNTHRGLARKVLPDVLGLFNSRLWSLWNPNV